MCYKSRHFLRVFSGSEISCYCLRVTEGAARMASQKTHKQLSHQNPRGGGQRTSSLSLFPFLSLCGSHSHYLLACINKATRHTHTFTHKHPHTDLLPRYVHDLTPVSASIKPVVTQSLALSQLTGEFPPFTLLNRSGLLWKLLLMSKTIQELAQTVWRSRTNPYNIYQQKL